MAIGVLPFMVDENPDRSRRKETIGVQGFGCDTLDDGHDFEHERLFHGRLQFHETGVAALRGEKHVDGTGHHG